MRSKMRHPLGLALGAALLVSGLGTGAVAQERPPAGDASDAVAGPAVGPALSQPQAVRSQVDDVVVSAKITLPSPAQVRGSITGTLTITHNGKSAKVTSGSMTMTDPRGRTLTGTRYEAGDAPDAWTSTVQLPDDGVPGTYQVMVAAKVAVTTADGVVTVPVATENPVSATFRTKRLMPTMWTSTSNAPAGATVSVSGLANQRSLVTGEHEPAADQLVRLYFDPEGDAPEALRAKTRTDERGFFTRRLVPDASGVWRAEMPRTDTGGRAVTRLPFTERERATTLRQGSASVTQDGFTAGDHLMTHDVVVGLEPVQRRVDVGSLGYTVGGTSGWVSATSRRGEGDHPDGYRVQEDLVHTQVGTSRATFTFDATLPAGVYDIGVRDAMRACSAPQWQGEDGGALDGCTHDVLVEDPEVTTIVVKRASATTLAAASSTSTVSGASAAQDVTLSGDVSRVEVVSWGADERPAADVPVKLYFDPEGSAPSALEKTVRTGADGTYSATVDAGTAGEWTAKHPGSALVAPSQDSVAVGGA